MKYGQKPLEEVVVTQDIHSEKQVMMNIYWYVVFLIMVTMHTMRG